MTPLYIALYHPIFSPDSKWVLVRDAAGATLLETDSFSVRRVFRNPRDKLPKTVLAGQHLKEPNDLASFTFASDSRTAAATNLRHDYTESLLTEWRAGRFFSTPPTKTLEVTRLWDVETGDELLELPECKDILYSPDGRRLAAVDDKGRISIWDVPPRRPWGTIALTAFVLWGACLLMFNLRWVYRQTWSLGTRLTALLRAGPRVSRVERGG